MGLALCLMTLIILRLANPTQYRVFRYNLAGIEDFRLFVNRDLEPAPDAAPLELAPKTVRQAAMQSFRAPDIASALEHSDTVAFLVLKDGNIIFERYRDDYGPDRPVMVYSITKSIVSLLAGIAIEDGLIRSVDQPASDYLPALEKEGLDSIHIRHLLQMTSGLPYIERTTNNPFGLHAHLAYTDNIAGLLGTLRAGEPPGTRFAYKSIDYALLGQLLDRALGNETITAYLQRKLWQPLGAHHPATWSVDSSEHGLEKTWCCLAMTARDLARFGLLMLDHGRWQDEQLVPSSWLDRLLTVTNAEGSYRNYQYGWWLMPGESFAFRAEGILGQFLYINPEYRTVIVRLGSGLGGLSWLQWRHLLTRSARLSMDLQVQSVPGESL